MHLIGIDVGTGGSRAVLIDAAGTTPGKIVASATVEHEPFVSPQTGWAEQDPRDWWRASAAAIQAAIRQANIPAEEIKAVGLSGQMHGSVLLDANDLVLRPALIWCDQRSAEQCRKLTTTVGESRLIDDSPVRSAVRFHCEVVHVAGVRSFRVLQAVQLRCRVEVCACCLESRTFTFRHFMKMDGVHSRWQILQVQFDLYVLVVRHWLDRHGADTFSGAVLEFNGHGALLGSDV